MDNPSDMISGLDCDALGGMLVDVSNHFIQLVSMLVMTLYVMIQ